MSKRKLWHSGEWVEVTQGLEQECCDCGLVHEWEFAVTPNGRIIATVERVAAQKKKEEQTE